MPIRLKANSWVTQPKTIGYSIGIQRRCKLECRFAREAGLCVQRIRQVIGRPLKCPLELRVRIERLITNLVRLQTRLISNLHLLHQ